MRSLGAAAATVAAAAARACARAIFAILASLAILALVAGARGGESAGADADARARGAIARARAPQRVQLITRPGLREALAARRRLAARPVSCAVHAARRARHAS